MLVKRRSKSEAVMFAGDIFARLIWMAQSPLDTLDISVRKTGWLRLPAGGASENSNWSCLGLILDLRPANERRRYFVTTSLIGRAQI